MSSIPRNPRPRRRVSSEVALAPMAAAPSLDYVGMGVGVGSNGHLGRPASAGSTGPTLLPPSNRKSVKIKLSHREMCAADPLYKRMSAEHSHVARLLDEETLRISELVKPDGSRSLLTNTFQAGSHGKVRWALEDDKELVAKDLKLVSDAKPSRWFNNRPQPCTEPESISAEAELMQRFGEVESVARTEKKAFVMAPAHVDGLKVMHCVAGKPGQGFYYEAMLTFLRQTADEMIQMHQAEVVHRDIKPTNVLVSTAGSVIINDFGLAAPADDATAIVGTPKFMAPEITRASSYGLAADVYSLGVVLQELMELGKKNGLRMGMNLAGLAELNKLSCGMNDSNPSRRPGMPRVAKVLHQLHPKGSLHDDYGKSTLRWATGELARCSLGSVSRKDAFTALKCVAQQRARAADSPVGSPED